MIENLESYRDKMLLRGEAQKIALQNLKTSYINCFAAKLEESLSNHFKSYNLHKKDLKQQQQTINYFIKLYHLDHSQQNIQSSKSGSNWAEQIKKVNLYSIFKEIDEKILFNRSMLNDFPFFWVFPKSSNKYQQLVTEFSILKQQNKQYSKFINKLLVKFSGKVKDEADHFHQIQHKYKSIIKVSGEQSKSELKLKDTVNFTISSLDSCKFLNNIDLSIVVDSGIMACQEYERLGESLYNHRFFLKSVRIKLMDMQFCQQKCDWLKRYLKKLMVLQKLVIQNYYSECKLGQFVDFNWHPYRKEINIKSGVWK